MRLLFKKYALDLGWDVRLTPEPRATPPPPGCTRLSRPEIAVRLLGAFTFMIYLHGIVKHILTTSPHFVNPIPYYPHFPFFCMGELCYVGVLGVFN